MTNRKTLSIILVLLSSFAFSKAVKVQCYDEKGRAQRCIPEFENAAFGLEVEATNTCGQNGPVEYCVLSSSGSLKYGCDFCNTTRDHSPHYMTDFSSTNSTWWQSETMLEGIQAPNRVNLTIHFGKSFDITYIQLTFKSARPHSFAIYKKTTEDGPWIPYQYYSANCREMYNLPDGNFIRKGIPETQAYCTSEYSDLVPLNDGNVPFALLEGRPSAVEFDSRPEYWEWVSATDIRITLDRLNTFGNEIWKDPNVLKSYFYAISDFSIGARCKCNGHASQCLKKVDAFGFHRRTCNCEHFTSGPDCNECLPTHNDAPWGRATAEDAHECQKCNCNGFSDRCIFDKDLHALTGHGGRCLECKGNRDGPNCERCRQNFYQPIGDVLCYQCGCNEIGSLTLQCNSEGKCHCKPGVSGDKCDRCDNNYYDFGPNGCKECGCNAAGSLHNKASCDAITGVCQCKENVEGKQCSSCKPGFFNLDEANEFGCTPCFCYGHSSVCVSATGYAKVTIENDFIKGSEKWKAELRDGRRVNLNHNSANQALEVISPGAETVYFLASERFLGDQRASYNHDLRFKLKINDTSPQPSVEDVVLEGAGRTVSLPIFSQGNQFPSPVEQIYTFRLHENPVFGWQPRLTSRDFMAILSNLTAVKIRGTYAPHSVGFLGEATLETARRGAAGLSATWVEMCHCPEGYVGQFCETCAPGSRHEPISASSFAPCVPCNCNSHAKICDADTGRCICEHNTAGANCDRCARGYYGNALQGTPYDCKACPCPNRGACMIIGDDDTVVCLECPPGYGGPRCELCSDGYYGDPDGSHGSIKFCSPCDCNLNVDPNAIGNCNRTTGECLKCIHNTGGPHCEQCLPGFYGDALAPKKGDCKPCLCNPLGTLELENGEMNCDQLSGQCKCKQHVTGTNCDVCESGYFDINSGQGCRSCDCDPIGSFNKTCNERTGQCFCRPGVTGLRCDKCLAYHYGFSLDGCKACECDSIGSKTQQCDRNGQCPCMDNVEGRRCDRCKENKYDRERDCVDCPPCYNLVKEAVDSHRANLRTLDQLISNISTADSVSLDADFEDKLKEVHDGVNKLTEEVKTATSGENDGKVTSVKLTDLYKRLDGIVNTSKEVQNLTKVAKEVINRAEVNVSASEQMVDQAKKILMNAEEYLFTDGKSTYDNALNKSKEVGQQNEQISQIARDARASVQKQEEEAEKIKAEADEALKISNEAYSKAIEAINKQKNISEDLKKLNSTLIFTGEKLNETINQVKEAKDQVSLAYSESLSIYRDVFSLSIPSVNLNSIKENSVDFIKKAAENQDRTEKLQSEYRNLLIDVNDQLSTADTLLQNGLTQQQNADELFSDVDNAHAKAEEAVKLGNKTLEEAQQTYNTLSEFNKMVQDSKDEAKKAIGLLPDIVKEINDINWKTIEAENTLRGAEITAQIAKDTAENAEKKFAQKASEEAYEIRKRVETTLSTQGNLKSKAGEVKDRVSQASTEISELKTKADEDQKTISEAKDKVSQAKTYAGEVKKSVDKALDDIVVIMRELNNLPEIDEASLNRLTEKLEMAEKQFKESNIDEELNNMRQARYHQVERVKKYQDELNFLQKEIDNLNEINSVLPDSCFKRTVIEN